MVERPIAPVVDGDFEFDDGVPSGFDGFEHTCDAGHVLGVVGGAAEDDVVADFMAVYPAGQEELHEGGLHGGRGLADVIQESHGRLGGLDEAVQGPKGEKLGGAIWT